MLLRLARPAALAAVAVLATCAGPEPASDAGSLDAGSLDAARADAARVDAARRDVGIDTGRDAWSAPVDAGDAAVGWTVLTGAPSDCAVEMALHPEELGPLAFEPCRRWPGGPIVEGCVSTSIDPRLFIASDAAHFDGVHGYVRLSDASAAGGMTENRLVRSDGEVVAAWRSPAGFEGATELCYASPFAMGGGQLAFGVASLREGRADELNMFVTELAAPRDPGAPLYRYGPGAWGPLGGTQPIRAVISETHLAVLSLTYSTVAVYPLDGSPRDDFYPFDLPTPWVLQGELAIVGAQFFAGARGPDWSVVRGRPGEPDLVAITVPDVDVRNFATDGVDMVWLEGWNHLAGPGEYERIELWTAPYDPMLDGRPAGAHSLGEISGAHPYDVGGGLAAHANYDLDREVGWVDLQRLSDGARLRWDRPDTGDGVVGGSVLYVSEREMLIDGGGTLFLVDPATAVPVP